MSRWRPSEDVRPVTEFRANAAAMLDHIQSTQRPVVLTQHGRSAAVLLGVAAYESLMDELALLRDLVEAIGEGVSPEVLARVRELSEGAQRRAAALRAAIAANMPEPPPES